MVCHPFPGILGFLTVYWRRMVLLVHLCNSLLETAIYHHHHYRAQSIEQTTLSLHVVTISSILICDAHDWFSITSQINSCCGQYSCPPTMAVAEWLAVPNLRLLVKSLFIGFIPVVKLPSKTNTSSFSLIIDCSTLSQSYPMRCIMCFCIRSENILVWPFNLCHSNTWVGLC